MKVNGEIVSIDQEQVGKLQEWYSGEVFSLIERFAGIGCVSFRSEERVDIFAVSLNRE